MCFINQGSFDNVYVGDYEFIHARFGSINMVFSTAHNGLNFNKLSDKGKNNLNQLKHWFGVNDVAYINQVHSDVVQIYKEDGIIRDGDALITDKISTAIGVFTADCVPILIADTEKNVIAAVHSGWKGTLKCIVSKTIDEMIRQYDIHREDLVICIGPHIRQCCYEVSSELIDEFKSNEIYQNETISEGRMLSLEKCILVQLKKYGIKNDKIYSLGLCTSCSKKFKFHSYRRDTDKQNRLFSFIVIDNMKEGAYYV